MDLSVFFEPISEELRQLREQLSLSSWGRQIQIYDQEFPAWEYSDILLIGCREHRGSNRPSIASAAQAVRKRLYELSLPMKEQKVADLGNFQDKSSPEAYYEMMGYVLGQIAEAGKTVVLIGGSQDLTLGQFMSLDEKGLDIEYVNVDSRLDFESSDLSVNHLSYNHYLLKSFEKDLFQYTNPGSSILLPFLRIINENWASIPTAWFGTATYMPT